MDFLREIVGGPKNRYKQNGFNLDLTYITDRIIAMAFPASGFEKLYRNSIDSVAQFLQKNHSGQYITVNLSGRQIDEKKLKNVNNYEWEDHRTPTFDLLFNICHKVSTFLKEDNKRVSVFHCNHGKGRTGTIICCFFLYCGVFETPKEALDYYARKRFETAEGYGVTQPAQIQYIKYFHHILRSQKSFGKQSQVQLSYPVFLSIKTITFKSKDKKHLEPTPYFKLKYVSNKDLVLNTKQKSSHIQIQKNDEIIIRLNEHKYFIGDVEINLKQQTHLSSSPLGSFMFNTAFIDEADQSDVPRKQKTSGHQEEQLKGEKQNCEKKPTLTHCVRLQQITPLSAQKSGNLPTDFEMIIEFKRLCWCPRDLPLTDCAKRCQKCKAKIKGELKEIQRWENIKNAVKTHSDIAQIGDIVVFGNKLRTSTV